MALAGPERDQDVDGGERKRRSGRLHATDYIRSGYSRKAMEPSAEAGDRPPAAGQDEPAVGCQDDLRGTRPAVVGRGQGGGIRAGVADRDQVATLERRQVVLAERVGRLADRAVDGDRRFGHLRRERGALERSGALQRRAGGGGGHAWGGTRLEWDPPRRQLHHRLG